MSNEYKTFHLGDLLSVTTPHLLAPNLMDGVQALLEHVTGETRESDLHMIDMSLRSRAELLRQCEWLTYAVPPDTDDRNEIFTWFAQQVVERGAYHQVLGATSEDEVVDAIQAVEAEPVAEEVTGSGEL